MKGHRAPRFHGRPESWPRAGRGDRPSRRIPAVLSVLGLVVLVAVLLFGSIVSGRVGAAATPAPPNTPPRLLVLGDSIILGTYNNIPNDLPGWQVTVDAAVSRSTAAGLDALATHGTAFDAVVVDLGANDGGTPAVFQPRVAALMNALASVPHVYWLTIHQARPYYATTNAIIRAEAAVRPNVTVADWNAAILPSDVGGDGLHLTPSGSVHIAAFVAGMVNAGLVADTTTVPPTEPPTTQPPTTQPPTTTVPPTTAAPTTKRPTTAVQRADRNGHSPPTEASDPKQLSDSGGIPVLAWLAPAILVLWGAGILIDRLRRRRRAQPGGDSTTPPST